MSAFHYLFSTFSGITFLLIGLSVLGVFLYGPYLTFQLYRRIHPSKYPLCSKKKFRVIFSQVSNSGARDHPTDWRDNQGSAPGLA